jgi:predicted MFS family arabinose efflux permease
MSGIGISVPDGSPVARRNLFLLAGGMAALYGSIQLAFGTAKPVVEETGGSSSIAGLAPALFLACGALAALPAGAALDHYGPRRVLSVAFVIGIAGCLLTALGVSESSLAIVLAGFAAAGVATGTILLSRAAAATMFSPDQRPRAIALVLFGAVFGAMLGPFVFGPILEDESGSALSLAWVGGAGFLFGGLLMALRLKAIETESPGVKPFDSASAAASRLRAALARPGVPPAVFTVLASLAAMVGIMALVGQALVDHGHEHNAVFPVLAAHFIGMFAFFPIVGRVIQQIGRPRAMVSGLLLIGASATLLVASIEQIHLAALTLLAIGLGWSLALVSATAELSERAPVGESSTLIGFSDLLGGLSGAALVAVGGFALDEVGLVAITSAATVLPAFAALWVALAMRSGSLLGAEAGAE